MIGFVVQWRRVLAARLRALVSPQRVREEIDEELRFHVEMRAQEYVRQGRSPDDARRAAALAFGSAANIKEVSYGVRGGGWPEAVWRDLTYAARSLLKRPTLSAVVIGVVAVGIGANAAILGVADRILWRQLPVHAPDELEQFIYYDFTEAMSYPLFRALREKNEAFAGVFARTRQASTFAVAGAPERRVLELVSGNYFAVLGVRPGAGRLLSDDDDRTIMSHPVAVVSDRYWRTRLGASESAIGRTILIDDYPLRVIGVAPPEFSGVEVGVTPDAWVPLAMHPVLFASRRSLVDDNWMWLDVLGRRAPGQSTARAAAGASLTLRRFQDASGERIGKKTPREIRLRPANRGLSPLRGNVRAPLEILMGITALVLLIACANVATLLLIRSMARAREIGVRLALGASRTRVIRQLFTESMLLALAGGVIGMVIAIAASRALVRFLPPSSIPTEIVVTPDARMLAIAILLSTVTGALFGVAPAIRATRLDLALVMREDLQRRRAGGWRFGARGVLVAGQVAISLVLVIGAGLFAVSVERLGAVPAGLDADHVIMASVNPTLNRYTPGSALAFFDALQARLAATPGVRAVGISSVPLLGGPDNYNMTTMIVPGRPRPADPMGLLTHTVGGNFFGATGTRLLRGRGFNEHDSKVAPWALVLSETAARDYFGDEDPIGRSVRIIGASRATIVGVVRDSKYRTMRERMPAIVYTTFAQDSETAPGLDRTVYVRTTGDPAAFATVIETAVHDLDRSLPVDNIRTLIDQERRSMSSERVVALLSAMAGGTALLLAAIGLYGLVVFDTQQRTREIGVRMALGATRSHIMTLVLRGMLGMVVGGTIVGLGLSRGLSRLVAAQLYGVSASDVTVVVAACATLAAAAVIAACVPAWRASRVNPLEALRCE
ncbi:MAG: ABC transporter permease [bacterium]